MCKTQPYSAVRDYLCDGDILLFRRPRSWIATSGRGDYSHAGMVLCTHGRKLCLEVREWYGGRAVMLSRLVPLYPEGIDVYRVAASSTIRIVSAVEAMLEKTGAPYSYRGVLRAALSRLPLLGAAFMPAAPGGEFCSQAVASAWYEAGVDLVPRLPDHRTEPNDLGRSSLLRHVARIFA